MWTVMDVAAREEFLAGVHVGVLSAALGVPGRTLAVPVWYDYRPGGLVTVLTGRGSRKAQAIRGAGRFSLCAQDEHPPYRYVSVEGSVISEEEASAAERLALARRYLGTADGDRYVTDNPDPGRENVAFRMRPEHWLSQDQGTGLVARLPGAASPEDGTRSRPCANQVQDTARETGQPATYCSVSMLLCLSRGLDDISIAAVLRFRDGVLTGYCWFADIRDGPLQVERAGSY